MTHFSFSEHVKLVCVITSGCSSSREGYSKEIFQLFLNFEAVYALWRHK